MQEYKIILTWEAIYDVTDIADYIEEEFGQQRADRFQSDLKEQMQNLGQFSTAFPRTQILYRGYSIHKRSFPPSIIFYIIMEETKEIHILRVLRHEQDWGKYPVAKINLYISRMNTWEPIRDFSERLPFLLLPTVN